jgi:hypothetical protein
MKSWQLVVRLAHSRWRCVSMQQSEERITGLSIAFQVPPFASNGSHAPGRTVSQFGACRAASLHT